MMSPERFYQAYGLPVRSEIVLPELYVRKDELPAQIWIRSGRVAVELAPCTSRGGLYQVNSNQFLLRMDALAGYLVMDGNQIIIDADPTADESSVRLFLLGSVLGALLHQRGLLPLHASAIETSRGAVLFAGASGTGKSALAAAFHARGYRVIADEICAIDGNSVRPAVPGLLLWPDTIEELDLWSEDIRQVRPNLGKFNVPVGKTGLASESAPVHAIYVLNVTTGRKMGISRLHGIDKIHALIDVTFRRRFLSGMSSAAGYMDRVTRAARQIPALQLIRTSENSLLETADLLESNFSR